MKNCPYCGQQNPEKNRFCNKCGKDMEKFSVPETVYANHQMNKTVNQNPPYIQSVWEKGFVKFILYLQCIFVPIVGLILGLLVSLTPFGNQKELSSKLITCACIATMVWFILGIAFGFIFGFLAAFAEGWF